MQVKFVGSWGMLGASVTCAYNELITSVARTCCRNQNIDVCWLTLQCCMCFTLPCQSSYQAGSANSSLVGCHCLIGVTLLTLKCRRIDGYRKRDKSAERKNAYLISSALLSGERRDPAILHRPEEMMA
jgi:hypothetical protein